MKTQIKEVQDYFLNKIVTGDYEVLESSSKDVGKILIDNEFEFSIWLGAYSFVKLWIYDTNFMGLPDFTTEQKEILFERFSKLKIDEKQLKIKQLEQQLKTLKNE